MSARSVLANLDTEKYEIIQVGITHGGGWLTGDDVLGAFEKRQYGRLAPAVLPPNPSHPRLYTLEAGYTGETLRLVSPVDVAFPVLHGTFGEDGTIQGLFEMAGLPYVGAGVVGSSLGMEKGVFKQVMKAKGIPTPETIVLLRSDLKENINEIIQHAEQMSAYPMFVKPANLGSSVGVSKCNNRSDLVEGLMEAARFDRRILIERGIDAREIEVSVLGNDYPQASVPGEILPSREFYSYEAKYVDNRSELMIPAHLTEAQTESVRELAIRAYQAIDAAGMARVDFLLDKHTGDFLISEVNTIPGFTQISMYPKLWEASGLPYPALLDRLIELAMERKSDRDKTEWQYRN
jgi:D-alanine-D-alanine ligase